MRYKIGDLVEYDIGKFAVIWYHDSELIVFQTSEQLPNATCHIRDKHGGLWLFYERPVWAVLQDHGDNIYSNWPEQLDNLIGNLRKRRKLCRPS